MVPSGGSNEKPGASFQMSDKVQRDDVDHSGLPSDLWEIITLIRAQASPDARAYRQAASIALALRADGGPELPKLFGEDHDEARAALLQVALRDLAVARDDDTVGAIMAAVAQCKGQYALAKLALCNEDERTAAWIASSRARDDNSDARDGAQDDRSYRQRTTGIDAGTQPDHCLDDIVKNMCEQARALSSASQQVRKQAIGLEKLVEVATTSADQTERYMAELVPQAAAFVQAGEEIESETAGALAEVRNASSQGEQVGKSVAALTSALDQIETVVLAISQLSRQTNLLSLNARIEASRSIDGGAGFAVVANEVKALASHTASLTAQASEKIKELRIRTIATSTAIATIIRALARSEAASGIITAAVHRQHEDVTLIQYGIEAVARESRKTAAAVTHARSAITGCHDAADLMEEAAAQLATGHCQT